MKTRVPRLRGLANRLLTPAEWRAVGKLLAIALMAVALAQAGTLFDDGGGRFIYGRF